MRRAWWRGAVVALGLLTVAAPALVDSGPARADPGRAVVPATVDYFTDFATELAAGDDGNVWFTTASSVGRLTPQGELTSFLTDPMAEPTGLAANAHGLWFGVGRSINRLAYDGELTTYTTGLTADPTEFTTGPDGEIWFAGDNGRFGVVTASGQINEHVAPSTGGRAYQSVRDLAVGDDGTAWVLFERNDNLGEFTWLVRVGDDGRVLARLPDLNFTGEDGAFYAGVGRGPDGTVHVVENSTSFGRFPLDGYLRRLEGNRVVQTWNVGAAGDVLTGPDDAVWFGLTSTFGNLGRLNAGGSLTSFTIDGLDPSTLISGPAEKLWALDHTYYRRRIFSITTGGIAGDAIRPPYDPPDPVSWRWDGDEAVVTWPEATAATGYRVTVEPPGSETDTDEAEFRLSSLAEGCSVRVSVRTIGDDGVGLAAREIITPLELRAYRAAQNYRGDSRVDRAVYRPSNHRWYVQGAASVAWGQDGDVPVPADYDGDGVAEIAVWRPGDGTWNVRGGLTRAWGQDGDVPMPADYDGDGKTDLAVWRPSNGRWYVLGRVSVPWGTEGDVPVPGNYAGDRRADLTVWRPSSGRWYTQGAASVAYGREGDRPVVVDENHDGRNERSVVRTGPNGFWVQGSGSSNGGDGIPIHGDFGGDGYGDATKFRPWDGLWIGFTGLVNWGQNGDIPV